MDNKAKLIFDKALELIPEHGCCNKVLEIASKDSGFIPEYAYIVFTNGISDLITYYNDILDQEMIEGYLKISHSNDSIRNKIKSIVMIRFSLMESQKPAISKMNNFFIKPENVYLKIKTLSKTLDKVWITIGDQSVDYNYYTKRFILATVYESTLLYWLYNKSVDNEKLSNFLTNRIENAVSLGKAKKKFKNSISNLFTSSYKHFN